VLNAYGELVRSCTGSPAASLTWAGPRGDVLALHEQGLSAEQIVREFTSLSGPADVYAALLYYHDHKSEIEADLKEDATLAEQYEREHPGR
jgi:hypothetical protein